MCLCYYAQRMHKLDTPVLFTNSKRPAAATYSNGCSQPLDVRMRSLRAILDVARDLHPRTRAARRSAPTGRGRRFYGIYMCQLATWNHSRTKPKAAGGEIRGELPRAGANENGGREDGVNRGAGDQGVGSSRGDLSLPRKGDARKVEAAQWLCREATMSVKWMAGRLRMSRTDVSNRLYNERKERAERKIV